MKRNYEVVKRDYLYLDNLCPGGDMVEIDAEVFDLMADPTKKRAMRMYEGAILSWFYAIGSHKSEGIPLTVLEDAEVIRIAGFYGIDTP